MPRTIADLGAGETVYLDETVEGALSHVPYFYLGKDESGNCILLRQHAAVQKRMDAANEAVYDGCEADLYLEDEETGFLSRFDEATRMALVSTQIKVNNVATAEIVSLARRCFLLSYTNLGYAAEPYEGMSFLGALKTATGQSGGNNARIAYNESLASVKWWMRSSVSETQMGIVHESGIAGRLEGWYNTPWIRPALSVAPATNVSEEGEGTIYLLPDRGKIYREIDTVISMGSSEKRPCKVKLSVSAENCTTLEIKVSNNAKDTEPVWVGIQNGEVADLPNDSKETENWEIGIHIYARSGGKAVIHEPVMLVTTED